MPARIASADGADVAADRLILQLSRGLSAPSAAADTADSLSSALQSLQRHARSFGFSSQQCDQLVRLALIGRLRLSTAGSSAKHKAPKTSVSLTILRSVIPRPRAKLGRQAVLDIVAALGPSPGTDMIKLSGMQKDGTESSLGPERVKVDSKVQVAALKLLCVALDSPSVPLSVAASFYTDSNSDSAPTTRRDRDQDGRELERLQRHAAQYSGLPGNLPSTYLTALARTTLEKCYATLFHFIDYQALRPHICYLLCRITKRKHVRHYRITKLMALRANAAPELGIAALLSTYANFYPDLLFPELLGGGGASSAAGAGPVGLKYPEPDWIAAVLLAHARCARRSAGEAVESDDEADNDSEAAPGGMQRATKKQRLSAKNVKDGGADENAASVLGVVSASIPIPNLVTIQPLNSAQKAFGMQPSLVTELSSLRHLAHSLDRLVLPSQAAAMLGTGFGARMMRVAVLAGATITNEESLSQAAPAARRGQQTEHDACWVRLSDWLESVLGDEIGVQSSAASASQRQQLKLPSTDAEFKRLASLLRRARLMFELAEQMPAKLEGLMSSVLLAIARVAEPGRDDADAWTERWDELTREVLSFVPLIMPSDLSSFEDRFMTPLEALARSTRVSLDTSAAVLLAINGLLTNWAVRDWRDIGARLDARKSYRWGISNLDPSVDFGELIAATSARADRLAATLVGLYPRHVAMEHAVLSLYEGLARHLAGMGTVASVPALPLYAFTLHATTIVSVSRLCGLIQDLRHAFEHHNAVGAELPAVDGGLESKFYDLSASFFEEENLSILNSRVTLIANLIWLGKIVTEDEAVGSLPPGLEQSVLHELTQRGEDLNLKLATLSNTPFSRAMSHLSERFANVYCAGQGKKAPGEDEWIRGPITPKTIKSAKKNGMPAAWTHTDFRAYLLDWLDTQGAHGMYELLKNILVTFGSQLKSIRGEAAAAAQ
ncbi:hypothetical protein PANT_8c00062 [Moesziomyces antarcticus T-34]|uniref:Uncharacterized protein n=1 Tax=Pseudozyma antarctica (strain T-34) TaxID=1151754 RepID=M9LN20_PSEA3|nr:hypothetical protein PANT_8c00062 [Moesziomyces antarcticus T-34]